ncbi:hypothetical protein FUA23_03805 [Neolewinella aurantiaca]|uniref:Uncharacterized protein n=1 Tax=Neolewinella aurantiaca TaxID=2602767 RepID=A0A5C7FW93_9BACT|nr:hypothetical protein [Neolewinella aurantiaca]TXF90935.1 hypothetical protein FUA23_03805 [Neolewinella aurantiaca]
MLRSEFEASLTADHPPEGVSVEIAALWWLCNHNWQKGHDLIDRAPGQDAAWVHALMHRMEGDQANARYWYSRAGREVGTSTIGQEVEDLLDYFMD